MDLVPADVDRCHVSHPSLLGRHDGRENCGGGCPPTRGATGGEVELLTADRPVGWLRFDAGRCSTLRRASSTPA
jgi:hypothetical protein